MMNPLHTLVSIGKPLSYLLISADAAAGRPGICEFTLFYLLTGD